ncbi:uncharacterized protein F4812DRAFT_82977 [Daldinia caldariorum]|uniref:uncharacterized protein n=1 Tax=Daldinia caldariorum TaxID=326644 RepID=UPI0020082FA7|nr:uncharacterized protein F4812DRAFT_82977 [Daldinia caldariorum]KAI1466548.1 hypothetical protein F4812DRAFT_82977 [Daldinia caldariorum]
MSNNEATQTQAKRRNSELSTLPKLIVPSTTVEEVDAGSSNSNLVVQPHALSVNFRHSRGEPVSPCSDVSPSSRCSVVSLSPSLFPLPPSGATPPTTAHSSILGFPPPRCATHSRSQSSISSWFSPPSPPPSSPLPPTPTEKRLASLVGLTNGLESVQVPACAKVKSPLSEAPEIGPENPEDDSMPRPRRLMSFTIDSRGVRESVIDPDAPLASPPLTPSLPLPPPYSPGLCTPERFSNASMPSSRVDSTTLLAYNLKDYELGRSPRSPGFPHKRKQLEDIEAGRTGWWAQPWMSEPQRRRKKIRTALISAASVALLLAVAGMIIGIYLAVSGSASL